MSYKYFASYMSKVKGGFCFGHIIFNRDSMIETPDHILEVLDLIKIEKPQNEGTSLINFILLSSENKLSQGAEHE